MWREDCAEKIRTYPPEQLQPNIIPRFTGNPLRFAERNIEFGAQTNVCGLKEIHTFRFQGLKFK